MSLQSSYVSLTRIEPAAPQSVANALTTQAHGQDKSSISVEEMEKGCQGQPEFSATENACKLPTFSHRKRVVRYLLEQFGDPDFPNAPGPLGGPHVHCPDSTPSNVLTSQGPGEDVNPTDIIIQQL